MGLGKQSVGMGLPVERDYLVYSTCGELLVGDYCALTVMDWGFMSELPVVDLIRVSVVPVRSYRS